MDNLYFKLKGVEDLTDKIVINAEVTPEGEQKPIGISIGPIGLNTHYKDVTIMPVGVIGINDNIILNSDLETQKILIKESTFFQDLVMVSKKVIEERNRQLEEADLVGSVIQIKDIDFYESPKKVKDTSSQHWKRRGKNRKV